MTARPTALDQAAGWVARLADAPDVATRTAFEAWRDASIDHAIAYEQAMAAWERLDGLSSLRPFSAEDVACPPAMPVAQHSRQAVPPARGVSGRPWLAVAASVALVLGLGSVALLNADPAAAYATRIGETRHIQLSDGTRVELNTDTLILVHMKAHRRQVDVLRGEAVFHVRRDPRSFTVSAGNLTLHADDADLAVRLDADAAKVIVTRGQVEMSGREEGLGIGSMTVTPNTVARLTTDMLEVQHVSAPEIGRQLAWREGAIDFNGQPLSEALAEFNRYNRRQVRLADPALGMMRIGGYFHESDLEGFIAAITQTLPLTARNEGNGDFLLGRRQDGPPTNMGHAQPDQPAPADKT